MVLRHRFGVTHCCVGNAKCVVYRYFTFRRPDIDVVSLTSRQISALHCMHAHLINSFPWLLRLMTLLSYVSIASRECSWRAMSVPHTPPKTKGDLHRDLFRGHIFVASAVYFPESDASCFYIKLVYNVEQRSFHWKASCATRFGEGRRRANNIMDKHLRWRLVHVKGSLVNLWPQTFSEVKVIC